MLKNEGGIITSTSKLPLDKVAKRKGDYIS